MTAYTRESGFPAPTHLLHPTPHILVQVVQYDHFKPYSDTHYAAAMGYGNLSYGSRDARELPERYGVLVPHTPHVSVVELARSCGSADHVIYNNHVDACLWVS